MKLHRWGVAGGFRLISFPARLTAAVALAVGLLAVITAPSSALASPNVLVIVTDDQRTSGTMDVTGPLDPMARTKSWFDAPNGRRFPEGTATTPLCCPSRSSIFTGRYVHSHGVNSLNGTKLGPTEGQFLPNTTTPNPQRTTLQYYLSQEAQTPYLTGIVGKYLNRWGTVDNPPTEISLDDCYDAVPPTKPPFFEKFWVFEHSYSPFCVNDNGTKKWQWRYSTDYVAKKAREFITAAEGEEERPWFLYVAPFAPHLPFIPRADHADDTPPPFSRSSSFFEQDRTDKPDFYRKALNIGAFEGDEDSILRDRSSQLLSLKSVDEMVDSIMNELALREGNEETLAIFTSDNGYMWGEHGKVGKNLPYLESVRVPFYIRGPGITPGVDQRLAANIDIAPTVLDAASGIDPPASMDGQSLLDQSKKRNRLLTENWQVGGPEGYYRHWSSLRTPTFHYIEHYKATGAAPGPNCPGVVGNLCKAVEYYDLTSDPLENENLMLGDRRDDPPLQKLSEQLAADKVCSGQLGMSPGPGDPDVLPPDTAITSKPDPVSSSDVVFTFTSSDPDSVLHVQPERRCRQLL